MDIIKRLDNLAALMRESLMQIELIKIEIQNSKNLKPVTHFMGDHPADYGE